MPAALGCLSGGGFGVHGQNNMEIFKLLMWWCRFWRR